MSRLKQVTDVYVLSVKGECKELLFVQQAVVNPLDAARQYAVHCLDFYPERTIEFNFEKKGGEEGLSSMDSKPFASTLGPFFYEPDVSVMKAQGFRALLSAFDVRMLDADCHYFTSSTLIPDFPGRVFAIDEQFDFASRNLKTLRQRIPQANVSVRNFPLTADQLRHRAGIRDGGDVYLFGARLNATGPILVSCHKINTGLQ